MIIQYILDKYKQRLPRIPAAGGGEGCHPELLGVANLGVLAGLSQEQIFNDIRQAIKPGKRHVPDQEILEAIQRAVSDHGGSANSWTSSSNFHGSAKQKNEPLLNDGKAVLRNIIDQSNIRHEVDILENSPVQINWPPDEDAINLLDTLYEPQDLIFAGDSKDPGIPGKTVKKVSGWIKGLKAGGVVPPHIIPNPLNGVRVENKAGNGLTLRGDKSILKYRFCIAEFDNLAREEQIRFWSAVKLPICALIDTAGKSIHAWIDCRKLGEISTEEQWNEVIKEKLYGQCLIPMGVDRACRNPARLSRLPGHLRSEDKYQRLLWLSPEGREVIA